MPNEKLEEAKKLLEEHLKGMETPQLAFLVAVIINLLKVCEEQETRLDNLEHKVGLIEQYTPLNPFLGSR